MGSKTLEKQWQALWESLGQSGSGLVFSALKQAYETPPRPYHNFLHIAHCLDEFQTVSRLVANPQALQLALCFHDAIYDSKAKDNEQRSAELAAQAAFDAGLHSASRN